MTVGTTIASTPHRIHNSRVSNHAPTPVPDSPVPDSPEPAAQAPKPDTTPGLASIAPDLARIADELGVKSVLVMRSEDDSMVVAGTAGEAASTYTVGAAGKKALDDAARVPLYCERIVDTDEALFVPDSRVDETFAGNEDEVEFGLHNYLGLPVHDEHGGVVGTVCVLDNSVRDYSTQERRDLTGLRDRVESLLREDPDALG